MTGPTWQAAVGARSAAVDASWGTSLDLNGDGYSDLALFQWLGARPNTVDAIRIYDGAATGLATSPSQTLTAPSGQLGIGMNGILSAGDVDGDGFGDLVVAGGVAGADGGAIVATILLYRGGPTGV